MKASLGRIVHYQRDTRTLAAIVTRTHADEHGNNVVDLTVFPPGGSPFATSLVPEGTGDNTWHWPEPVDDGSKAPAHEEPAAAT